MIGQSPKAGTGAEKDAEVKLDVSKGPPLVAVPRVVDLPCQQAKQQLEALEPAGPRRLQPERRSSATRTPARTPRCRRRPRSSIQCVLTPAGRVAHEDLGRAGQGRPAVRRRGRLRGGAGVRVELARLGAAARRPGAGRAFRDGCGERGPAGVHPRVAAGEPRLADRATVERSVRDAGARAARGARRSAPRRWSSTPAARSTRRTPTKALHQLREALLPLLDRAAAAGAAAAAGRAERGRRPQPGLEGGGPRALPGRGRRPPVAGRLLRHLPRLGGRARPGHPGRDDRDPGRAGGDGRAGPAAAGARQRLARTSAAPPGTGTRRSAQGRIGAAAFAELLAHPATAGVPVIVETPSDEPRAATPPTSPCSSPCGHAARPDASAAAGQAQVRTAASTSAARSSRRRRRPGG